MPYTVLVSYSWENSAERAALTAGLEKEPNLRILYDSKHIGYSQPIHTALSGLLAECDALLVLLTKAGLDSREVREEVVRAHERGKLIIPIVGSDVRRDELPWFLQDIHHIPYSARNFDQVVQQVTRLVRGKSMEGGDPPEPAPAQTSRSKWAGHLPRTFACSDSVEFQACIQELLPSAHRIVMIGTGLNLLQRDPLLIEVLKRGNRARCRLEVILADPESPAVQVRLIEEEMGMIKPPVGYSGLANRLKVLIRKWQQHGRPDSIRIRLFTHYPTFAMLILDQNYFIYPYGFSTLGNFSPVFRFSADDPTDLDVVKFLEEQYQRISASSLDAELALQVRSKVALPSLGRLHSFAIYFIPPADSSLYRFGSMALGYDVRSRRFRTSPWESQVGSACDFGFHLTVCDALYFLSASELQSIRAEVEVLLEGFAPFDLEGLRIEGGFPDAGCLSIVPEDPSGSLEAIHHELVHRVYRRAAASNYSLGRAPLRDETVGRRARLMIRRYKVPYVLQKFQPHFTLLTQMPERESDGLLGQMEQRFDSEVKERSVRVKRLALMSCPSPESPWEIDSEVELGQ